MLRRNAGDDPDADWRRGVEFAAWCLMGAAMRDMPPVSADYQRAP